ncbi:hypothetical protein Lalb_Chr24g0403331 [Lupinus albus]|uniref:Uncharacterized protein n=1 Tax=Lupinus albus TaxID=3870 RepID=A0A6A4MSV0_LUPAL|nr:hypothetical protein Lalb_Chr24g0403331 [Lupinus albus]
MKKSSIALCFFVILFVFGSGLEQKTLDIGFNPGAACKVDNDCFCHVGAFPLCCLCKKGYCSCLGKDGKEVLQSYANVPNQIP